MEELIPYELTLPGPVLGKMISDRLEAITNPKEMVEAAWKLKSLKQHPAIVTVSDEHRHEIWWGEILAYWKAAELLDGYHGAQGQRTDLTSSRVVKKLSWEEMQIHPMDLLRWRRLHEGFTWPALMALKEDIQLPKFNTLLNRIPNETILVVPSLGRYPIIYADPPWKYDFAQFGDVAIDEYRTLSTQQIINYSIDGDLLREDYFDKSAVLFLWATNPKLVEAIEVLLGWGFTYKTNICWDKIKATSSTMGKWLMGRHELLLIGTKGNIPPPSPDLKIESVYSEMKTGHSKKPQFFYDLIEKWYKLPKESKYLELFGREKHSERWEILGNQVQ